MVGKLLDYSVILEKLLHDAIVDDSPEGMLLLGSAKGEVLGSGCCYYWAAPKVGYWVVGVATILGSAKGEVLGSGCCYYWVRDTVFTRSHGPPGLSGAAHPI